MVRNNILSHLCCAVCVIAIAPIAPAFRANAQAPSTDLSFEVATVKPVLIDTTHRFDPKHFWVHVYPARATYWSMSLDAVIEHAYDIRPYQLTGPEWAGTDRFDIEAKFPEGVDKKDERRMLQTLLKDRFKLAFHIEQRELEGYALVVGKHGEKLKPSLPDPPIPETGTPSQPADTSAGEGPPKSGVTKNPDGSSTFDMGKRGTVTTKFDPEISGMHYEHTRITMEELAISLSTCLGSSMSKLVDETGLKGTYQLAYDCPFPTAPRPSASPDAAGTPTDPQGASPLTRSLDALGLKLEKRKMMQDVYVIDHVEKPSEN